MAAKQPPRRPIPPDIQKAVLTKSRRRCALCFQLNRDTRQKRGQIAHLDRRRSNNNEFNLAWLCFDHHDEYDSKTSQHKNYTIEEVKHARKALYAWVKRGMPAVRPSKKNGKQPRNTSNKVLTVGHIGSGPEIILEYEYGEDSKEHHDANRQIVVRNVSTSAPAYNVEVLPLMTDQGSLEFEPRLISCIAPGESKNVFADLKGGASPLFSRGLPNFLIQTYADEGVQELVGTKTFTLRVRYQGSDPTMIFETECELLFRPWKKRIKIGKIIRHILRTGDEVASAQSQMQGLPERRPMITPASFDRTPERYEGLFLTNEGTPAYDVRIDPISLQDGWSVTFEGINRLEKDGFSRSFTSREGESVLSLSGLWRLPEGQSPILPLIIRYRNFGGRWYKSICELHRDVMKKSGFEAKFIRQE